MSDPTELIASALGGGGGATAVLLWLFRRGQSAVEKTEEDAAKKLDQVLEKVGKIELSLATMAEKHSGLTGEVVGLRDRVNGGLENHATRIGKLEETVTRLDERARRARK